MDKIEELVDRYCRGWSDPDPQARERLLRDAPTGAFSTNIFWDRAIEEGRCFGAVHQGLWFDVGSPPAIAATEAALVHG